MGYQIKRNGIEMRHGEQPRTGCVVKKSWGTDYYLIDYVVTSWGSYYYVAAWRCNFDNTLQLTSISVSPNDIVCNAKITDDAHNEFSSPEYVKAEFRFGK